MPLRRIPKHRIATLDDVAAHVASSNPGVVLIVDVDNTLVAQGVTAQEFRDTVNGALDSLESLPGVSRVIAITNGPQRGVGRLVSRGNKPWTTRRRLGLNGRRRTVVVVGDQILTDGVLAWRLGAVHLHLVLDDKQEPSRQALMRRMGSIVEKVLFLEKAHN